MTPWTGWERRESHASSPLLLLLPKLDISYRKAQANNLDLSTLVQIQVSSAWFCSCLYRNDLASISASCNVAKSVEAGSEFGPTWSIASQSYNIALETQSRTGGHVPFCWQVGLLRCSTVGHLVILLSLGNLPQDWTYNGCAGSPLCHCSVQFIQVKSPRWDGIAPPRLCMRQHEDLWAKPRGKLSLLRFDPSRKHRVSWEFGL